MVTKEPFEWKNIRLVPVLHNRLEFATEVRRQFASFQPEIVAIEYPPAIGEKLLEGIERLPLLSVIYYEEKDHTFVYLPIEPTDGQIEAVRLALSQNLPVHFIDRDTEGYPIDRTPMPDPYSIKRIGYWRYCRSFLDEHPRPLPDPEDQLRERTMAYHLQRLHEQGKRIMFVGGLAHLPGLLTYLDKPQVPVIGRRSVGHVMLAHLHAESSREIMTEIPFVAALYERFRDNPRMPEPDRLRAVDLLVEKSRKRHLKSSKEEVSLNQLRTFNKFVMNYALLSGFLTPDLYKILVAARGVVDDNFAYELWDLATEYPWQTDSPRLPVLRLRGTDLFLDQKRIRFYRHFRTLRRRLVPLPVKKRQKERFPGEWKREFKAHTICSFQPEDIIIEGFGNYVKRRAVKEKSEENSRVVPFLASMMDGIDMRETLRNIKDGTIYVRENVPLRGKVGSVVVIFDPDLSDARGKEDFPWRVTWLGEHNQESDMAFYSTPAGEVVVGPGISRCQYGGFMLTFPPLRVYDIWKDPFFDFARNKPERLLLAALDYSLERHVGYVSSSPPSSLCRTFASRLRKQIIYLPIGIFSPVTLKKIRQFHVLDGHPVRSYAAQYI
ncbi:MAG: hypothetical protein JSV55_09680 [Deltaproteobacteria bacterium]|nr:MAG: hypothetical protein JSV55_09680 [Deltaproteobacteria bacterium]